MSLFVEITVHPAGPDIIVLGTLSLTTFCNERLSSFVIRATRMFQFDNFNSAHHNVANVCNFFAYLWFLHSEK